MSAPPSNPCATCGACCRSYIVPICGYDMWRICEHQRLDPMEFLVAYPQIEPTRDGFRLDHEGQTYALALDKQGRFDPKRPCLFLTRLADGNDRCGIYTHRPTVCQSYPMGLRELGVVQRADALCPPDSWAADEPRQPRWRAAVFRQQLHFEIYHRVVACWNRRVAAAPAEAQFHVEHYFLFLLNLYARLGPVAAALEASARLTPAQAAADPAADITTLAGIPAETWHRAQEQILALIAEVDVAAPTPA
jgi:Fe-S-cluster containining protein